MDRIFKATVTKGKVVFQSVDLVNKHVATFEGKPVEVVIRKKKKKRTNPQNAWYWSCVVGIPAEHIGYLPDEMHEAYKFMFLKREVTGKPLTVRSTTSLTTLEFSEYVEKCRQWAAEEGIVIPSPEEIDFSGKDAEAEAERTKPVDAETLELMFARVGHFGITHDSIMELCRREFNGREPRELNQSEAEQLDSLIVVGGKRVANA